jgi:hypothetical protein
MATTFTSETDTPPKEVVDEYPPVDENQDGGRKRRRRSDAGKPRGPRKRNKLAPQIARAFHLVSAALVAVDPYDALVIGSNADKLGAAWGPVLERYPRVMQAIASLEKGGAWGAAILTTAGVALPIIYHHRPTVLPEPLRGLAASMSEQYHSVMRSQRGPAPSDGAAA